jgi:hypothetical protein
MLPLLFCCCYFYCSFIVIDGLLSGFEPRFWVYTPKSAQNYEEKRKQANFFLEKCFTMSLLV